MGQDCCATLNNLHHCNKSFWCHINSSKYCMTVIGEKISRSWVLGYVRIWEHFLYRLLKGSCCCFLKCSIFSRVVEGEKLLNQWMDCLLIDSWTKFMDYQLLMSKMSELCHFPHFLFAISSIVCLWHVFFFFQILIPTCNRL